MHNRYKVMVRMEMVERKNGEPHFQWFQVRSGLPRGHAEAICTQILRDGLRGDGLTGATFYPPWRFALVETCLEDVEISDARVWESDKRLVS